MLIYILLGGLSSAIYNEVLQFFLIVAGFVPLVYLGLRNAGGWSGIRQTLPPDLTHSWRGFGSASTNAMGVDAFGLAMGLGFVLSFGYWCTDFLVVQRAMAARLDDRGAAGAAHRRISKDGVSVPGRDAGPDCARRCIRQPMRRCRPLSSRSEALPRSITGITPA